MESEVNKIYTLTLNAEEHAWLKAVLQNPLQGQTPEDEPVEEALMRSAFWDVLNKT
jgi:hypothetical protein